VAALNLSHMTLPANNRAVRYLCTGCGAWRHGDANKLIVAGIEGCEPDSADARQVASAQESEMPFIGRHGQTCRAKIRILYPNDPQWQTLDGGKRED
jgi:hypothetical protein